MSRSASTGTECPAQAHRCLTITQISDHLTLHSCVTCRQHRGRQGKPCVKEIVSNKLSRTLGHVHLVCEFAQDQQSWGENRSVHTCAQTAWSVSVTCFVYNVMTNLFQWHVLFITQWPDMALSIRQILGKCIHSRYVRARKNAWDLEVVVDTSTSMATHVMNIGSCTKTCYHVKQLHVLALGTTFTHQYGLVGWLFKVCVCKMFSRTLRVV